MTALRVLHISSALDVLAIVAFENVVQNLSAFRLAKVPPRAQSRNL